MSNQIAQRTRSHKAIIESAGGPSAVGRLIDVDPNTTKAWKRLDSIPAAHWQAIANAEIATLEELASAAAARCAEAQAPAERAAA